MVEFFFEKMRDELQPLYFYQCNRELPVYDSLHEAWRLGNSEATLLS